MKQESLLTIAQHPEKTIWNTTTVYYDKLKSVELIEPIIQITKFLEENDYIIKKEIKFDDFEDKIYQTLVEDNSLKEKPPIIIPISNAIQNLNRFVENFKQEIKEFRILDDKRLDEISFEEDDF